jgi:hypothetical protein
MALAAFSTAVCVLGTRHRTTQDGDPRRTSPRSLACHPLSNPPSRVRLPSDSYTDRASRVALPVIRSRTLFNRACVTAPPFDLTRNGFDASSFMAFLCAAIFFAIALRFSPYVH